MTLPEPRFSDYGDGGDEIGARRSRRAFRRAVWGVLLLCGMLFVSENYLRYEQTERLFRLGISFPVSEFPSARTVLRSAVKQDAEIHSPPTAKYYEALAEREEEDRVLPAYAKAYELDPNNAFLAIRFGCALMLQKKAPEALEVFSKASEHDPRNALPAYLQAAAMPRTEKPEESLALVARTNSSGNKVSFPHPLWISSFPTDGACYQDLRRHIVDENCAPLLQYSGAIMALADSQIKRGQYQNWDAWLGALQEMGDRLARQSEAGTRQALAGLQIERDVMRLREQLHRAENTPPDPALHERLARVESALAVLTKFEEQRDAAIQHDRNRYEFPKWLWIKSFSLMFLVYFLAVTATRLVRPHPVRWAIRHRPIAWRFPAAACALLLALLAIEHSLNELTPATTASIALIWWGALLTVLAFGLLYPSSMLPAAAAACGANRAQSGDDQILKHARKARRQAYVLLARRYYGVFGGLLIGSCVIWILAFRIVAGIYPHYVELLTTGLPNQELNAVIEALRLLQDQ